MTESGQLKFDEYEKALNALAKALAEPKTDITRDATIQRFEFCVELAWKMARKAMATSTTAPRAVVREMAAQGLIDAPEEWFGYLEARNLSSHTYREELAEKVYSVAAEFIRDGRQLLEKLKSQ